MRQFQAYEIRIITEDYTYTSHASHTVEKNTVIAVAEDGWYIYTPPFRVDPKFDADSDNWPPKRNGKIELFRDYWRYLLDPSKSEKESSPHNNAYRKAPYKVIV